MVKIPTFESRRRITAEPAGVTTGIQVSPTATPAAALSKVAKVAEDYYIKKRDTAEKVESAKKVFEIKGELDKYLESEKENINDEDAINNFKSKYNDYVNQQLSQVKNRRVKKRIEQNLDLELSEYVYNIKKNSYKALESESLINVNNKINSLSAKYGTTLNSILKVKFKSQAKDAMRDFASDFDLPKNVLDKKLEAIDRDFLLADMQQFIGKSNGAEQIKKLDESLGATKFLTDQDFGKGIFAAYNNKISELTVQGDPNANYDRALELIDELKTFKRSNGYSVKTGEMSVQIDNLEQKITLEEGRHENFISKLGDNKAFNDFSKDSKTSLLKSITDKRAGIPATLEDRLMANEIEAEYDQMISDYIDGNPEASLDDKKSFVRNLTSTLNNIYQDRKISNLKSRSFNEDTFDIVAEKNRVMKDAKLLSQGDLSPRVRAKYEKIAKINGYITTVTENDKKVTKGDIGAFFNDYLPILIRQVKATESME